MFQIDPFSYSMFMFMVWTPQEKHPVNKHMYICSSYQTTTYCIYIVFASNWLSFQLAHHTCCFDFDINSRLSGCARVANFVESAVLDPSVSSYIIYIQICIFYKMHVEYLLCYCSTCAHDVNWCAIVVNVSIIVVKKSQIGCTFIYLFYTLRAWMSNVSPQTTRKTRFKQNQIFLKALTIFTKARRMSAFNAHELSWDASWPLNFNGTYINLSSQCSTSDSVVLH